MELFNLIINKSCSEKEEAIDALVSALYNSGKIVNRERFKAEIYKTESEISTAVGSFCAIPHALSPDIVEPSVAVLVSDKEIDWGKPVFIVFMIASNDCRAHLEIISRISLLLLNEKGDEDTGIEKL